MKKEDKVLVVNELVSLLEKYPHFYLTDIEALPADKTSDLRRECFKNNVKLIVVKNTLMRLALKQVNDEAFSPLYDVLKGNTAVMFAEGANSPAKVIKAFTKDSKKDGKPELKGAYVQESLYIGSSCLEELVNIKSKEELIADVILLLESPIKNTLSALQSAGTTIHGVLKTLQERN